MRRGELVELTDDLVDFGMSVFMSRLKATRPEFVNDAWDAISGTAVSPS